MPLARGAEREDAADEAEIDQDQGLADFGQRRRLRRRLQLEARKEGLIHRGSGVEIMARFDDAADGERRDQGRERGENRRPFWIPGLEAHRAAQPDAAVNPDHKQQEKLPRQTDEGR